MLFQVSLSGSSPLSASPDLWTGSYTLSSSAHSITGAQTCNYAQTDHFTATPIAPLTGIYTGQGYNSPFPGLGSPAVTYKLQVSQGTPALVTRGNFSAYELSLSANLTVAGSSCFTTGTTVGADASSYIAGDTVNIVFLMEDGSYLAFSGFPGRSFRLHSDAQRIGPRGCLQSGGDVRHAYPFLATPSSLDGESSSPRHSRPSSHLATPAAPSPTTDTAAAAIGSRT